MQTVSLNLLSPVRVQQFGETTLRFGLGFAKKQWLNSFAEHATIHFFTSLPWLSVPVISYRRTLRSFAVRPVEICRNVFVSKPLRTLLAYVLPLPAGVLQSVACI